MSRRGFAPIAVRTRAQVHLDALGHGYEITRIELATTADVPGIDAPAFETLAQEAARDCPVSKALASVPLDVEAVLAA